MMKIIGEYAIYSHSHGAPFCVTDSFTWQGGDGGRP